MRKLILAACLAAVCAVAAPAIAFASDFGGEAAITEHGWGGGWGGHRGGGRGWGGGNGGGRGWGGGRGGCGGGW